MENQNQEINGNESVGSDVDKTSLTLTDIENWEGYNDLVKSVQNPIVTHRDVILDEKKQVEAKLKNKSEIINKFKDVVGSDLNSFIENYDPELYKSGGDINVLKQQLVDKSNQFSETISKNKAEYDMVIGERDNEILELKNKLDNQIKETIIDKFLSKQNVNPDVFNIISQAIAKDFVLQDGSLKAFDNVEIGSPRLNDAGKEYSLSDSFNNVRSLMPTLFGSSVGTGSNGSNIQGGSVDIRSMSPKARRQAAMERNKRR